MAMLRRSLYIGLGGTGIKAILKTKKMFIDNYGEVPPMIGFIGIDTARHELDKFKDLDNSEKCSIAVQDARMNYDNRKRDGEVDWIPEINGNRINTLEDGAGQIRTHGRFAFYSNKGSIERIIIRSLDKISSEDITDNEAYGIANKGGQPDVYIVCSVCGGTGCGTFIDVAYLIRCMINERISISGYAVLPGIFKAALSNAHTVNVRQNAYGAILDLDYIVHKTRKAKGISLPWLTDARGQIIETRDKLPYDAIHLIDNTNESNLIYSDIDDITSMISLALISSAGDIGAQEKSTADNTRRVVMEGNLVVQNKDPWVSAVGASQIVFRGTIIADLHKVTYSQVVIDQLTAHVGNGNAEANSWIDRVNIREHDADQLINTLSDKYILAPEIENYSDAKNEMNLYIQSALPTDTKMSKKVEEVKGRVIKDLKIKIDSILNQESGEGNVWLALETLNDIKRQIKIFKDEMETESTNLEEGKEGEKGNDRLESSLNIALKDLASIEGKLMIIGKSRKLKEAAQDVTDAADKCAKNKWEIFRRGYAVILYRAVEEVVNKHIDRIKAVKGLLYTLKEEYQLRINKIENSIGRHAFANEIDLTDEFVKNISIGNISVGGFLNIAGNLYDINDKDTLAGYLDTYTETLHTVKKWRSSTIDDIINNELSDSALESIIDRAIIKSEAMIKYNDQGEPYPDKNKNNRLLDLIDRKYFIGLPDKDNSKIKKENIKRKDSSQLDVQLISTGLNDRIIIYRNDAAVPPFYIESLVKLEKEYQKAPIEYHFDNNIYNDISLNRFTIMPRKTDEDNEQLILEAWVKGFIFGLIKYDKISNSYWLIDSVNGKAMDNYWINTKEVYRDRAYAVFYNRFSILEEQYSIAIESHINNIGQTKLKELINDVKKLDSYYDNYSQISVQKSSLNKREFAETKELVEKELDYVYRKLGVE